MAGPIGIAVMNAMVRLVCPHCGTTQVRGRSSLSPPKFRVCSRCHKHFDEAKSRARAAARPGARRR